MRMKKRPGSEVLKISGSSVSRLRKSAPNERPNTVRKKMDTANEKRTTTEPSTGRPRIAALRRAVARPRDTKSVLKNTHFPKNIFLKSIGAEPKIQNVFPSALKDGNANRRTNAEMKNTIVINWRET